MSEKRALVITPTTGAPELATAYRSVMNQTYKNTDWLVVVDGPDFVNKTDAVLKEAGVIGYGEHIFRCNLPFNTGGNGYYGHRIMATFSHLVNYDYILFLDQDNWFDENHVESLVNEIEKNDLEWAYSLRKITNKDGKFVVNDDCESLGRWPVWCNKDAYLIDSSSYCFTHNFIRMVGHIWDYGWGADRRFYTIVKDEIKHNNYKCSGLYTLNYRLGGNEGSVTADFFIEGNDKTKEQYPDAYPWAESVTV